MAEEQKQPLTRELPKLKHWLLVLVKETKKVRTTRSSLAMAGPSLYQIEGEKRVEELGQLW